MRNYESFKAPSELSDDRLRILGDTWLKEGSDLLKAVNICPTFVHMAVNSIMYDIYPDWAKTVGPDECFVLPEFFSYSRGKYFKYLAEAIVQSIQEPNGENNG